MSKDFHNRVELLYRNHYDWLFKVSVNLTRNAEDAEDLIQSLFVYIMEKGNEKIYYKDTFNLLYLHRFIKSRFINNKKRNGRMTNTEWFDDNVGDEEYDSELDNEIMIAYEKVMSEVDKLKDTKLWADALIFKMYFESDESLNELSKKLNVSKSTVFLSVKRIKTYIKELVDSPFKNE